MLDSIAVSVFVNIGWVGQILTNTDKYSIRSQDPNNSSDTEREPCRGYGCCVIDPEFQVLSMILWLGHNVVQSIDFISARGGIFGKPQKNQQPWYSWPSKIFASLFLIYKDLKWILFRSWAKDGNVHVLCHPILICVTRRWFDTEKWKRLLIRVKPT